MKALKPTVVILAIVMAVAAAIYAYVEWVPFGEYPGNEFFDLAAQTIPILLVALAVEAQARKFDRATSWKLMRIAVVIVLAAGETTAVLISAGLLHPESESVISNVFIAITAIGLLGGFLGVIAVAVSSAPEAPEEPAPPAEKHASGSNPPEPAHPSKSHKPANTVRPAAVAFLTGVALMKLLARCAYRPPGMSR